MVTIRLARRGRTERPFYHIVVTDSRKPRDSGCPIERLGFYNPVAAGKEVELQISEDRVSYWLAQGAKPSEQVKCLLKKAKNEANNPKKTDDQAVAA